MKKITSFLTLILVLNLIISAQITEFQKFLADDGLAHDEFGRAVATSGNYAIIGAHQNNTQGDFSGCAYIFENNAGIWVQTAKLVPDDGEADDEFGYSVSISGNYAIVGAYMDDDNGDESGSAYIFYNNGNTWEQMTKLTAIYGEAEDYFGYSVSISGNYAIVGAYGNDDNGPISGSAYIFYNNLGVWEQTNLIITGNDQGDKAGTAVYISEDYAVVGAMNDDDNGANSGAVYVFKRNAGTWSQTDKITSDNISENDYFGNSVEISDSYIVVGAYHEPHPNLIGKVYVFENNNGIGTQIAELAPDNGADGDLFGCSVSVFGDTVVVGAHQRDDNGTTSGAAYVYTYNGSSWEQIFTLLASDGSAGDNLGFDVNISENCVILGAYGDDDIGDVSGSAYVYYLTEDVFILDGPYDVFVNVDENAEFYVVTGNATDYQWQVDDGSGFEDITNSGVYSNSTTSELNITNATLEMDGYKYRCVISNTTSEMTSNFAVLHVGNSSNPSVIIETQKILASDGQDADNFGYSVDVSGDYLIVGAYQTYSDNNEGGYAYIFKKNNDEWEEIKKLSPSDGAENDDFGLDVAIDGNYAVVGSYRDDDNGENSGSIYIYAKDEGGTDNWGFVSKFSAPDGEAYDYFGYAVGIAGDWIMSGSYSDDDINNASGAVYVYYNNSGTWEYDSKIKSNSPGLDDRFGWAIDVYEDNAIIGANNDAAYIFHNNAGSWEQVQEIQADDENSSTHEYFGISVGIAEDYAVVGAFHDPWPDCNGSAYVFYYNGTWEQQAKLVANDGAVGDNFGSSVAIWADTVIVGAPRNDYNGTTSGSAYAFTKNGSTWEQLAKMVASDGQVGDRFGFSVAICENTALVGARADDDNGTTSGSAYVFDNLETPLVKISEIAKEMGIIVYPNPSSDYLFICTEKEVKNGFEIKIFDISGNCVYKNDNYENQSQINISHLNSGIYIITTKIENILNSKKLIIE
ncbi:MAG: T9SS type A sorting domain-containing protein [Bacteroidales bacterium]|nr:T9SS type A sorting domain-containing protein [Bacteroidales bacterium]